VLLEPTAQGHEALRRALQAHVPQLTAALFDPLTPVERLILAGTGDEAAGPFPSRLGAGHQTSHQRRTPVKSLLIGATGMVGSRVATRRRAAVSPPRDGSDPSPRCQPSTGRWSRASALPACAGLSSSEVRPDRTRSTSRTFLPWTRRSRSRCARSLRSGPLSPDSGLGKMPWCARRRRPCCRPGSDQGGGSGRATTTATVCIRHSDTEPPRNPHKLSPSRQKTPVSGSRGNLTSCGVTCLSRRSSHLGDGLTEAGHTERHQCHALGAK
jgi:hypothetical protein